MKVEIYGKGCVEEALPHFFCVKVEAKSAAARARASKQIKQIAPLEWAVAKIIY